MDLGYARVSTREQDLTGQVAELQAAGCAKIYSEKASGARGDRAELPDLPMIMRADRFDWRPLDTAPVDEDVTLLVTEGRGRRYRLPPADRHTD